MSRRLARARSAAFATLVAVTGALLITIPAQAAVTGATSTTTTTVTGGTTTTLAGMSVTALASDSVSVSVSTTVGTLTVNTGTGITLAYGYAATGSVIAFTGNGTQVNAALGSIQLTVPGSAKGSSATVAIVAQEGTSSVVYSADTGHYYEYVANSGISWSAARAAAQLKTFSGQSGYLATVPSAAVNALITSKIPGALNVWLGGRAIANFGGYARSWQWMDGPLAGTVFTRCSAAVGACDFVNSGGFYQNWASGEPNNFSPGEESIVTNWNAANGLWNDLAGSGSSAAGYVVEYGNLAHGSTGFTGTYSASSSVAIVGVPNAPTGVSATSGLRQATVSFTAPANNGGAAIDGYLITVSPGGATVACASSPCSVTGLTGGQATTFGVQAHNTYGYSTTASSSAITIGVGPSGPMGMTATAVLAQAYSNSVSAAGYPPPTYSIVSGDLPSGLALNGTSGAITGTPTTIGAWSVTITATNIYGSALTTFWGSTEQAPTINTTTLGTLWWGTPVDFYLSIDGIPAPEMAVTSGALPSGLTLDANGRVHGTPNVAGVYTLSITATNTHGSDTQAYSGIVGLAPSAPTGMSSTAVVGQAYSDSVSATGFPAPTYTVVAGDLPGGLSLDGTNGAITGTPTSAGAWSVTITATNTYGSASTTFTGTTGEAPTINTTTLGALTWGTPVDFYLSIDGTPAPAVTVASGDLPSGLTLDADGRVHGTPNAPGAYALSVLATNVYGTDTQAYGGTVAMAPASPTGMTATAVVGQAYSDSVSAAGYPLPTYSVTGGALPGGLSLDGTSGAITGTPTTAGAWSVTITATNTYGSASTTFTGTTGEAPTINTTTLGTLTWGTPVDFYLSIDGTPAPAVTVASGALPSGLTLDADGRVHGTPNAVGPYTLSITATNTYGTDTQAYSGTVDMAPASAPTITGIFGSNGSLSVEFTAPTSSGGGTILTYLYSIDGGATWLPRASGTTESPLVIVGLINGTSYSVMVLAVNDAGSGTYSSVVLGTAGSLAATGFSIIPLRAALALMIAGALLIMLARRRERALK
jgi:hypothetical protein